jgi:hypothetical protein
MSLTNFPNGITSFGIPIIGSGAQIPATTGKYFFVHSGTGSNDNSGTTPDSPLATLDNALGKCRDSKMDVIVLMPGHSETITGAGGITLDKIGVYVVGLGTYDLRPRFLMDGGTTVTALITAANCSIENCIFAAGHADVAIWGKVTAKGCKIKNCLFEQNVIDENWVDIIHAGTDDNDYDGLEIIGNEFHVYDDALVTAIDLLKNANDVKIVGNRIVGDFNATPFAPIYCASTEIQLNILVSHNYIHNLHDGDAVVGIAIANTASTGWIVHNLVGHQDAAGDTPILAGAAGLFCGLNYASGVLGTASGYLYPAADS